MNNQTNYQDVIKSVKQAVSGAVLTENKWEKAGNDVAGFYPTAESLDATKAQFIADAILPALDNKYSVALAKELPRKGSKEFIALTQADQAKWEIANQAKKDARAICHTMYSRIKAYAFPPEKKEVVKKGFADKIKALIEEGGKLKEADFDLVKVMGFLTQAYQATGNK